MILNTEQLRQKARELALVHDLRKQWMPVRLGWREFNEDVESLQSFIIVLQDCRSACSQPAEEWLLDHADFIKEQAVIIRNQISSVHLSQLPRLRKNNELRIQSLCREYLEHADGTLDVELFVAFINSYQEVSILTMSEAWSIPIIMRIVMIRRLAEVLRLVRERHEVCVKVGEMLSHLEPSKLDPNRLKAVLEAEGEDIPLSAPLIVHLVSHLNEWADDVATVREWLMCKLDNGAESLNQIVSFEHQLQAAYQVSTGNLIQSLRSVSRWNWRDSFERICLVEQTLRRECSGDYPLLDFTSRNTIRSNLEKLAARMRVPENLIAQQAVHLADEMNAAKAHGSVEPLRQAYAAYYLLDPTGIKKLREALKLCSDPRANPGIVIQERARVTYFTLLASLFSICLLVFAKWVGADSSFSALEWTAVILALMFPASEWAVTLLHLLIGYVMPARPLLRYDFSNGISPDAATMVVIPVIWSTTEEVAELAARLELHYLANRDPYIHFALLGDFVDSHSESLLEDQALLIAAKESIDALNTLYKRAGGTTFHLFQRRRKWNDSEKVWMGWERKRGKLVEFVELIKGRIDSSYDFIVGDSSVLAKIRYIVTLDADTQLPMGSAQRMIGTMHLPYNRPRLNDNKTRVIEGFGVLQPRIGISHEAVMNSRLASLWSGEPGIDPYAFAASDPYQDGLGEGIFTGKGIFDVEIFAQVLCDRIPENQVLSHDLLESGFLRAGLLSDIELIDGHPATFNAYQQRLHRWVRGDWQLLNWLFPRVMDRRGELVPVDISILTRWQMIDNLRRSLLLPVLFAILTLSFAALPGTVAAWLVVLFTTLSLPIIRTCASIKGVIERPRAVITSIGQVVVTLLTLPFQSALLLDGIGRSLYRLFISKRRLLEWVNSAEIERRNQRQKHPKLLGFRGGYALITLFLAVSLWSESACRWIGLALCVLWALTPLCVRWLNRPTAFPEPVLAQSEEEELRVLAVQIWAYFEDFAVQEDHYLPPDNVQIEPPNGVAHRTSPTNIGLLLACTLAARNFQFIDTNGLIERVERTVNSIEALEKWSGHLYNWYDTLTLSTLPPLYVSTVDSGNFVAYLILVKEGIAEWLKADFTNPANEEWLIRGRSLISRLEKLINETDFIPLYDNKAQLFSLGCHVSTGERETILYDLLASEARQASFLAIALGQVSIAHWFAMGRTMTKIGKRATLISWSGTMFEYLMPSLIMRTYQNTIWDSTYRSVIARQVEYARQRGVPFGISESGYYAFDFLMNYQYRAFGVPGLGFKRGLEQDLVVAPYATIMALPYALRDSLAALRRFEDLSARGQYGFYEAVDCTQERLPDNQKNVVIRSFMAHHQGMSLLTLANVLLPQKMYDYFHLDKRVQAAELLLQERIPAKPAIISHTAFSRLRLPELVSTQPSPLREYISENTMAPEVCVLSNENYTTVVSNSGSGYSRCRGIAISRWREDPVTDQWGSYIYIRDGANGAVWSPTLQPCLVPAAEQRAQFSLEKAVFMRVDGDMHTSLEICVSPEWDAEVRRLTLTNVGSETKIIEITTFIEIALASPAADDSHPAFSKLFVQTEYDAESECLLASRRPRDSNDKPLWAVHSLSVGCLPLGSIEYETDRACFIGRGNSLSRPQGIHSRLSGTVGSVLDPAFIIRRRLTIEAGQCMQLFAVTGAADSREEAISISRRLCTEHQVERTFQLAKTRSQIELRHLHLTANDATVFQTLASRAVYISPLRSERMKSIEGNTKGQSTLWAHGISGDVPIVTVKIVNTDDMPLVMKLVLGHEYLRRKGLLIDLIIMNDSPGGYQQVLQESIRRSVMQAVGHEMDKGAGGIFILAANQLSGDETKLLLTVSRILIRAGGPSLKAQLQLPRVDNSYPAAFQPSKQMERYSDHAAEESDNLLYHNGWGGFSPDGKEYRIILKNGNNLTAPWANVIANRSFGSLITELGTGYTWWRNSRECKLTPWSNDAVLDQPGEICYLRDEESGEVWSPTPSPIQSSRVNTIIHGRGYTRFINESHGIRQEMTIFVPLNDPVKVIELRLINKSGVDRSLSVTYYAEWVLGVRREANSSFIVTEWDESAGVLLARNSYQETFRDATAFLRIVQSGDTAASDPAVNPALSIQAEALPNLSWTADRHEFIGRNGTLNMPAAMSRQRLSGTTGSLYNSCGAVQQKITLKQDSEQKVIILLGCEHSRADAQKLVGDFSRVEVCEQQFNQVKEFWNGILEQITITSPCAEFNVLVNGWLLYQTLSCRMWARTGFYQAGGAYGFRDQLQDSIALLHTRPDLTRAQILLHAAHQFEEGDVQHWWHEETLRGVRTRFSDDLLWLPYSVDRYVQHTGDETLLDERVPFLHSELLRTEEHERYEPTVISQQSDTIYEHCLRAIERSLQFGEHGLPLIGIGDWNDGLSRVGYLGKGESVWLGWFLSDVLVRFADLCEHRGDFERSNRYRTEREKLMGSLNEHAWDGQWYRRAWTDHGHWLGSIHNEECRIDAIAQSWAVITDGAPRDRAMQAMHSFDRELVDRNLSVVRLLTPPFDRTEPSPGYIQGYPPGIRENGGQYTHGVIWNIIAWCKLGEGDKAFELFHMLNPLTHTKSSAEVRKYTGEPYVMSADVYTADPHEGRAGWTWYTGAAGWMYQTAIEWIIGLRRRGVRLYICPCIPHEWPEFSVTYKNGTTIYNITVLNPTHKSSGATALKLDGLDVNLAEHSTEGEPYLELSDDGAIHHAVITL